MSTKIYNGFAFVTSSLELALDDLKKFQKELKPIAERMFGKVVLDLAIEKLDCQLLADQPEPPKRPFSSAWFEVVDRQKKVNASRERDPEVDFDFDVSVIPLNHRGASFLLGIPFTDQPKFRELLEAKNWYVEYGYWNSTDRPDKVSAAEWTRRKRDWDKALPEGIPSLAGYNFTLVSNDLLPPPKPEEILPLQTSVEDRARAIAREAMWRTSIRGKDISGANFVQLLMEFERDVVRKDGPQRADLDHFTAEWIKQLRPITMQDLFPERTGEE